jgi:hypothetical protein
MFNEGNFRLRVGTYLKEIHDARAMPRLSEQGHSPLEATGDV